MIPPTDTAINFAAPFRHVHFLIDTTWIACGDLLSKMLTRMFQSLCEKIQRGHLSLSTPPSEQEKQRWLRSHDEKGAPEKISVISWGMLCLFIGQLARTFWILYKIKTLFQASLTSQNSQGIWLSFVTYTFWRLHSPKRGFLCTQFFIPLSMDSGAQRTSVLRWLERNEHKRWALAWLAEVLRARLHLSLLPLRKSDTLTGQRNQKNIRTGRIHYRKWERISTKCAESSFLRLNKWIRGGIDTTTDIRILVCTQHNFVHLKMSQTIISYL